tara:strand:- start:642 stop:758 length:117 start_codon:yes stop_codon:yes gene_type:complete
MKGAAFIFNDDNVQNTVKVKADFLIIRQNPNEHARRIF